MLKAAYSKSFRYFLANLANLYGAPDALATISANFLKDYNPRVPFSKNSIPLQRAAPSPFMPLTVGLHTASIALNTMTYASAPIGAVASKNTFHNAALSPNQISGDNQRQILESHAQWPMDKSTISSSSRETVETSRKRLKDVAGDTCTESHYDQNHSPGESSTSAYPSAPSKSTLPFVSPNVTMLTFLPLEALRPHSSSSLGQSNMISDHPWSQPLHSSDSSASATTSPQTIGVKRRLGMGRSKTGYSNKKFKPPA